MLWGVLEDSPCWPLAAATHLEPRHAGGCPRQPEVIRANNLKDSLYLLHGL